jgi:hypothetical protein
MPPRLANISTFCSSSSRRAFWPQPLAAAEIACHAPVLSPVRHLAHAVTYASSGCAGSGAALPIAATASAFLNCLSC